jgi:hypothetical protein
LFKKLFLDEMISNIYIVKSNTSDGGGGGQATLCASESIPFLKSLNAINGTPLKALIEKIVVNLKQEKEPELLFKLILLIMITTNEHKATLLMNELLILENKLANKTTTTSFALEECLLVQIRQEINPFHAECFNNSVKSMISSLASHDSDELKLNSFVNNLIVIYEWDLNNKCFMKLVCYSYLISFRAYISSPNRRFSLF